MSKLLGEKWLDLVQGLWKCAPHFLFSGFAGLLVYWWIWTTELQSFYGGTSRQVSGRAVYGIPLFLLLLLVSVAVWVHVAEDYTINLF